MSSRVLPDWVCAQAGIDSPSENTASELSANSLGSLQQAAPAGIRQGDDARCGGGTFFQSGHDGLLFLLGEARHGLAHLSASAVAARSDGCSRCGPSAFLAFPASSSPFFPYSGGPLAPPPVPASLPSSADAHANPAPPEAAAQPDPAARLAGLLQDIALGDRPALRALYDLRRPKLLGLALRITNRRDWAEDVVQESFVSIWHHAGDYRLTWRPP